MKQAKSEWKATGTLDVKASDLGGAKAALLATVEYNQKGETKIKPKVNVEVSDEFNIGVSAVYDMAAFKEIWGQIVYKPADMKNQFFFLRNDVTRSLVSIGSDYKCAESDMTLSGELTYGYKDLKGIKGQPVTARIGADWDLSDVTQVSASVDLKDDYSVANEISHAYDKNWTLSATQSFDNSNVGSKVPAYHFGFGASYKL